MTMRFFLTRMTGFLFTAFLLHLLVLSSNLQAANFPLEITNIKPAGTGSPAIPATNRIFRAYPGIEYNIRAAVIGGVYPFTFSLSNAPSGMTVNSASGEITWSNPATDTGTITLTVVDAESTKVSASWQINVTKDGFIFVNSSYLGPETGALNQPYSSIENMLNNETVTTDIVYFRGGNYTLPAFKSNCGAVCTETGQYPCSIQASPWTWLAYPGEAVNIDADDRPLITYNFYFDGINFYNHSDYAITTVSGYSYNTLRRCSFTDLVAVRSVNENQGYIFTWKNGVGYYMVIQDNTFTHWTGAAAIGSIYYESKILIEDNICTDNDGTGMTGWALGIAPKDNVDYLTIRGNYVEMPYQWHLGATLNALYYSSDYIEICYNLLIPTTATRGAAVVFNGIGYSINYDQHETWFHHNTVIGDIQIQFPLEDDDDDGVYGCNGGPYHFYNNVIINPNTDKAGHYQVVDFFAFPWGTDMSLQPEKCLDIFDNLTGTAEQNIVDSSGNLTSEYAAYVSTHGYQSYLKDYTNKSSAVINRPTIKDIIKIE